jgi:protease II
MQIRRALAGAAAASPGALVYPLTPVHPVVDHYFGHAVVDPYRWLENPKSPAVKAWAARQSALTLSCTANRRIRSMRGA